MKTKYLKATLIFILCLQAMSCKAQNLPLHTGLSDIPTNAYVKDLNNELIPYIGVYESIYGGNNITLFITKEDNKLMNYGSQKFYRDALVIKYIVKNSSGTILQDTKNNSLPNITLHSTKIKSTDNSVIFFYSGTNCGVGWGDVFLKKLNSTQISWEYKPESILLGDDCPANADKTVYLPVTKDLIFTKQ